jgi:transglutaminase-like putative cysteine protease
MSRVAALAGLLLVAAGLGIFAWKVYGYGLPVMPSDPEGLWRVELSITVRGTGGRGSVRAPLPSTGPGQEVYDERSVGDRLVFSIRPEGVDRIAIWRGRIEDIHDISYGFRARVEPVSRELPDEEVAPPPREVLRRYGGPTAEFPSDAPQIAERLGTLALPPVPEVAGRLRTIFAWIAHEVATQEGGSDDALITLSHRAGSERGKTALLVAMLRAARIPARPALGLELGGARPRETVWAEAWVGGGWAPLSPKGAFFAARPANLLLLRTGALAGVESTGTEALTYRYHALREHLGIDELASLMVPPNRFFAAVSLYQLPVATQSALRSLLLFPLGALVLALFRNVVGVQTFGTFMPVLVAFALRQTRLGVGLAMVAGVIAVGVFGRVVLERLRLLLVPRLSILLCLVVLGVTAFALLGRSLENRDFFSGVLFPIVILTMLCERFSISIAEEGMRNAFVRAGWSMGVTGAVYPIMRDPRAEHLMFSFPELTLTVIGLLVWIGGYTGYRLMDLIRFRSFAAATEGRA